MPAPERHPWTDDLERLDALAAVDYAAACPPGLAARLGIATERRGPVQLVFASTIDMPMLNRAMGLGVGTPASEDEVEAIAARFTAAGSPRWFVHIVPGAAPAGALEGWLEGRGLAPYNRWMKLGCDLSSARLPAASARPAWRVERIDPAAADAPAQAETFAAIDGRSFGLPEPAWPWTAALLGRPGWSMYLAWDGETPIACAALFVDGEVGWFGFAATVEAWRRRGAQSALILRRLADARAQGCRRVVVETAEDRPEKPAPSFRNLVRLGFEVCYPRPNWLGRARVDPGR
jgi:GNAT superfamily N-acetyltransferase